MIGDGPTITFTEPVAIYNFLPQLSVGGVLTGNGPFGVDTATSVARVINAAFAEGTPSTFVQNSLVNGACQ